MTTDRRIISTLDATRIISEKHQIEAQLTGRDFNIFSITKIETKEVNTHSAMISELLNPQGLHHQGAVFLKLFLENVLGLEGIDSTDYAKAKVTTEHYIGELGRIDIVVRLKRQLVVIENKINAPDEKGQLARYAQWMEGQPQNVLHLYYLTKHGIDATEYSHQGEAAYTSISYETEISVWLDLAIKEVVTVPIVFGAILQYQVLVKKITGNMGSRKKMDLINLLQSNEEHMASAIDILRLMQDPVTKGELQKKFWLQLQESLERLFDEEKIAAEVVRDSDLDKNIEVCMGSLSRKKSPQFFGLDIKLNDYAPLAIRVEKTVENVHVGFVIDGIDGSLTQGDVDNFTQSRPGLVESVLCLADWPWVYHKKAHKRHICHRRMQDSVLYFHNKFLDTYYKQKLYKQESVDACAFEVIQLLRELKVSYISIV
jgi:hypothetical protein